MDARQEVEIIQRKVEEEKQAELNIVLKENEQYKEKLEILSKKNKVLEKNVLNLEALNSSLEIQNQESNLQLKSVEKEKKDLSKKVSEVNQNFEIMKRELEEKNQSEVEKEVEKVKETAKADSKRALKEIDDLKDTVRNLEAFNLNLKNNLSDLRFEKKNLWPRTQALETQLEEERRKFAKELQESKDDHAATERAYQEVKEQSESHKAEIENLISDIEVFDREREDLQGKVASLPEGEG